MKRAATTVILLCFAVVAVAQQQGTKTRIAHQEIRLRAKVKAVVPLQDFSGRVIPVDIDPHFALTVTVVSATPAIAQFTPRTVVTFAIHSPSIVFAGDASNGKTYNFSLCLETEEGKVKFSNLGVLLGHDATIGGCR